MTNNSNSLVILDWDNTLFPSTWTTTNLINLTNVNNVSKYNKIYAELDDLLYILLSVIMEHSKVIIITNALPTWVSISSKVLPKTQKLLKSIRVVSARKEYQNITSDNTEWKIHAFNNEVKKELQLSKIQNIISVGDASYEYNALINLYTDKRKKRILKSMKFMENPSFSKLKEQLAVLIHNIKNIIKHNKHLDLVFENK